MASVNQNNKRAVETILVTSGNQRLVNFTANGGALPGGGTRASATADIPLMSAVNAGYVNLNDGQLGVFSASAYGSRAMNVATLSTDTFNEAPEIYIAQGTATSQTPGMGSQPLTNNRPYESSLVILGRHHVVTTARVAEYHAYSIWNIGETTAITTQDLTRYSMSVAYHGQVLDTENSLHAYTQSSFEYTTPDYTALGLTTGEQLDHFVQNFCYQVNRNSKAFFSSSRWGANEPMVAFAIGTVANGAQDITGAGYDLGGSVNVFTRNGNQHTIYLNKEMVASLRAAMPANYGILNIDLSVAGTTSDAEFFMLMALDRDIAYDDRKKLVKIRLDVGFPAGFNSTVSKEETSKAFEGQGVGRHWYINYQNTAGQRKYAQFQRKHWPFIEVPFGGDINEYYNVYLIEHRSVTELNGANLSVNPKLTVVLVPTCDTATRDDFESIMNTWLASLPSAVRLNNGVGGALNLPDFDPSEYCA
jgi:hypothetical protein